MWYGVGKVLFPKSDEKFKIYNMVNKISPINIFADVAEIINQ